jgi:hypothetical protein
MVLSRTIATAALLLFGCSLKGPRAMVIDRAMLPSVASDDASAMHRLIVLVFFSPTCDCLSAHDERLVQLYRAYHPHGVDVFLVDSETGATPERDAVEAQRRGYPFPIVIDRGAKLANALGAEFASYSVVVDSEGRVRYHGGIDSDQRQLHEDAQPYVQNAIDDLLAGRSPRVEKGEALGCTLQTW